MASPASFEPDFASPSDWAMMYRACGLQVVPARHPSFGKQWKRPLEEWKEFQETLIPQTAFDRWYGNNGENSKRANMGFIAGRCSGNIFVIDLDEYKNNAATTWWLGVLAEHNNGIEPETWEQVTGGGGRQLFFRAPAQWTAPTNRTKLNVDIRGQGGFAMLPPSIHESRNVYNWKPGRAPWEGEIADAETWLLEAVEKLVREHGGDKDRASSANTETTESPSADFDAFGARIDGRDHYMRDLIWAAMVNWYRECPIAPTEAESQSRMREAYAVYERKVKSRLDGQDTNSAKLEREGRGPTLFAEKWRYALNKWSTDIAEAAQRPFDKDEWQEATAPSIVPSATPAQATRFVFEKIADLRKLPPAQWLVKGWIPEAATGIFYGKWAAGKSFIGFDLSLHLAYGMPDWHGVELPGQSTYVLVIAREGHQGFVNRVDAFKKRYGLVDDADHIKFMRGSVSFMRDDEFSALCEAIKAEQTPYKLILVDTVARVLPGVDMNEQQTATMFMERIALIGQITGAASIGVHHQNKTGGMMGSTFFEANADFVFEVSRSGEEDSPLTSGEIVCTKMKDGEDRWKRAVSYSKIMLGIAADSPSSLVVDRIGDVLPAPKRGSDWPDQIMCERIQHFIREAWDCGKPLSTAINMKDSGRYAPAVIAKHFGVQVRVAEDMIRQWLNERPEMLSIEISDKKTKAKGLKVVGQIGGGSWRKSAEVNG